MLAWLAFQAGGPTSTGALVERIERAVTRPVPAPPAREARPPARVWVPDRLAPSANGAVRVPGHWEERVGEREFRVPPLVVCTDGASCRVAPGGVLGPADRRGAP